MFFRSAISCFFASLTFWIGCPVNFNHFDARITRRKHKLKFPIFNINLLYIIYCNSDTDVFFTSQNKAKEHVKCTEFCLWMEKIIKSCIFVFTWSVSVFSFLYNRVKHPHDARIGFVMALQNKIWHHVDFKTSILSYFKKFPSQSRLNSVGKYAAAIFAMVLSPRGAGERRCREGAFLRKASRHLRETVRAKWLRARVC